MDGVTFELATLEHAKAIQQMRSESATHLTETLGIGHWTGFSRLPGIRERIKLADPETLSRSTIYVACLNGQVAASVVVSTFPPGFWKRSYWREPKAPGLGVFNLVVFPSLQRRGLGRFAMEAVEELARNHGLRYVRLDAYETNPISNAFYQGIGYDLRATINLRGCGLVLYEKDV
jgi:ribosomal protein S18 acetylase RimI-like enzyme